jgi:2-haloacid dehalogenase
MFLNLCIDSGSATPCKPFYGVYDAVALSQVKALVFDTFGTVVDWRSSLITELSKFGREKGVVADLWQHYKPEPEVYQGAYRLLGLGPNEVMLVAAHNYDLRAARSQSLCTAFIPRPNEYGPRQQKDFAAEEAWTVVASDLCDLASLLST